MSPASVFRLAAGISNFFGRKSPAGSTKVSSSKGSGVRASEPTDQNRSLERESTRDLEPESTRESERESERDSGRSSEEERGANGGTCQRQTLNSETLRKLVKHDF